MIATAPEVDVVKDWFDYVNLLIGTGGFVAAVAAIFLARRAQKSADTAITDERRRSFELEILRDMAKDLDDTELVYRIFRQPSEMSQYRTRLNLLSTRLPFWDQVANSADNPAIIHAMGLGAQHRDASERADRAHHDWEAAAHKFNELHDMMIYIDDDVKRSSAQRQLHALRLLVDHTAEAETAAREEAHQVTVEARAGFGDKLAYDVNQAVLERVEARKQKRLPWRYRL